jgi:hypothetical protein
MGGSEDAANARRAPHRNADGGKVLLEWEEKASYLCKFKGTLTPDQMREDLVFERVPDSTPYRARIVDWW